MFIIIIIAVSSCSCFDFSKKGKAQKVDNKASALQNAVVGLAFNKIVDTSMLLTLSEIITKS